MGAWSDAIMAKVRDRIETEADSIGVEMVADIREKISIPVEYREGTMGVIVIRSDPWDYPRREFSRLWESEDHSVRTEGAVIELAVSNDCPYVRALHDGHDNVMPRPFHDKAMNEVWRAEIPERMKQAIVGAR